LLTRACAVAAGFAVVSLASAPAFGAGPGEVTCPPNSQVCVVIVEHPGTSPAEPASESSGGGAGQPDCRDPATGEELPCRDPVFGWWSQADGCYYSRFDPQPPSDDPVWRGRYPDGAVYLMTCPNSGGSGGGWVWLADPPPGYGGETVTPGQLAQRAVDSMRLTGPDIGMAPERGKTGLVGLPVWMWTRVSATTWGPATATASVPGLSVTATANARKIMWNMGDGHTVICNGPGMPYTPAQGATKSPDCGHVYTRSSANQPNTLYTVRATTTWDVTWTGGGQTGALTVTRSSTTQVRIGEMQVLVS
jgi:hypothetical protein